MTEAHTSDTTVNKNRHLLLQNAVEDYFVARRPYKDSPHTLQAYRQDISALTETIADITGSAPPTLALHDLTLLVMRQAFSHYAEGRAKATIRRCWSTWNTFFDYLVSEGHCEGNPMAGVARPSTPRRQPKPFGEDDAHRLVVSLAQSLTTENGPRSWAERDFAAIVTLLITGVRSAELLELNIGDIIGEPGQRRLHVHGKGEVDRQIPIEPALEVVLDRYLASRLTRFPAQARRRSSPGQSWSLTHLPAAAALFVDRHGERMRRGGLQYLVRRAYRSAGIDAIRSKGALVHALRHTFASRLVERGATAVELMELLGHRSLNTTQHYVRASGREVRDAAAANPVYRLLDGQVVGDTVMSPDSEPPSPPPPEIPLTPPPRRATTTPTPQQRRSA